MTKSLVTGGAGFIGAHLVARLVSAGERVCVLDNFERGSRNKLAHLREVEVVDGDIRDLAALRAAASGSDVIYHLAAQSNVLGAVHDPEYSVTTNVVGTFNVLRVATELGAKVVFTSSREVYGEARQLPVAETELLAAKNAYGASKVAGEAYCRSFLHTHGTRVEILRFANVYGTGDSGRVIPLWVDAAREGRELTVFGGGQVIDFVWVGTAVDALVHAAKHELGGPVNVGSGVGTPIVNLAERVLAATGSGSRIVHAPARSLEVEKFVADTRRMRSLGLIPDEDPLAHLPELVRGHSARPRDDAAAGATTPR